MDVRVKRTAFAVLTVAAILLPLRKEGPPRSEDFAGDARWRSYGLRERLSRAVNRWSALEQRDSALGIITRRNLKELQPEIVLSGFPTGAKPIQSESTLVAEIWKRIAPTDSLVRVVIIGYETKRYEDASFYRAYRGNLIRRVNGETWCVAILPGSARPDGTVRLYRSSLSWGLSPCALLAAFGPPGSAIEGWLRETQLMGARSLSWARMTGIFDAGERPWARLPDPDSRPLPAAIPVSFLRALVGNELAQLRSPPYWFGAPGLRCIAGNQASCVEGLVRPGTLLARDDGLPGDLLGRNTSLMEIPDLTLATARPVGNTFLSDLLWREGRDRFRHFWRSKLPFEEAFQDAFGQRVGEWTAEWAKRRWLGMYEARYGNPEIALGVTFAPDWVPLAMVWTGIALLGAGVAARRREVT